MVAELSYYRKSRPIVYQCQECEEVFSVIGIIKHCPGCFMEESTNLIILHAEHDPEMDEMLTKQDIAAGD